MDSETARIKGKAKVVFQEYPGTIDSILRMKREHARPVKTLSYDFGASWMFNEIDKIVDIAGIVDEVISRGKNETGLTEGEYIYYTF